MKHGKTRAAACLIPILVMSVLDPAAAGDDSSTPLGGAALLGNDNGWTRLIMFNGSRIIGNKASHASRAGGGLFCIGNGGAIAATGGSRVFVRRAFGTCHTPLECSAINNNRAGDTGGAVFARGPDTIVLLERTIIRNNAGESGAGADLFAATGSSIGLIDSLVYRGAGPNGLFFDPSGPNHYTVWIENNAALLLTMSTMADTQPESAVICFGGSDSAAFLTHSIIHEQGGSDIEHTNAADTPHVESKCVMWHSDALTSLGGTGSHADNSVADPQFVNRDAMNFQLRRDSPAVDYCEAPEIPEGLDLLWRWRGVQVKGSVLHGPWDLGAFEVQPDALFSDRFEE